MRLVVAGLALTFAVGARLAGAAVLVILGAYLLRIINLDATPLANLNGLKREIAFIAAAGILTVFGGGKLCGAADFRDRIKMGLGALRRSRHTRAPRVGPPTGPVVQ